MAVLYPVIGQWFRRPNGTLFEVVAIDELIARRDHLENYGDKARFALADSYDRATQSQARVEVDE